MRKPKVFVIQIPHMRDVDTGHFRAKFDLTPAEQYGEIIELLGPSANPLKDREEILAILNDQMAQYTSRDSILCTGNPVLIGWAVALAAGYNEGSVRLLQWNRVLSKYDAVDAKLW